MLWPDIIVEEKPCPLGCFEKDEVLFTGRDRLHNLPGEFTVVRCLRCGLMRTNPRPARESMSFYYPDDYGPYKNTKVIKDGNKQKPLWKRLILKTCRWNDRILPPKLKPGKLLEIGCAAGEFLHLMAQKGWQVNGIEFSEKAANDAKSLGLSVYAGLLENAPAPIAPYDLVVGWMVLEHLHDPVGALRKLCGWSKSDAYIVLSVPNAAALEFSLFGNAWYALQLPTHLFHFTPESLSRILAVSGWRLEKIFYHRSISNLIGSVGNILEDKYGQSRLSDALTNFPERPSGWPVALYPMSFLLSLFGQTGRITIWARKI
jgi:SAM-dependent methyltransferase